MIWYNWGSQIHLYWASRLPSPFRFFLIPNPWLSSSCCHSSPWNELFHCSYWLFAISFWLFILHVDRYRVLTPLSCNLGRIWTFRVIGFSSSASLYESPCLLLSSIFIISIWLETAFFEDFIHASALSSQYLQECALVDASLIPKISPASIILSSWPTSHFQLYYWLLQALWYWFNYLLFYFWFTLQQ